MDPRQVSQKIGRVLITGGSGFLGGQLGAFLHERQLETRLTASSASPTFFKLNMFEKDWAPALFKNIDAIIHCAALIRGKAKNLHIVNCQGTEQLIKAAERYGVSKFIFVSSIDVLLQDTDYAQSKRLAEERVRESELDWRIVRPSLIFGPREHNFSRLEKSIDKLPFLPLPNRGTFLWQPVYVQDLVGVIFQLLQGTITVKEINVIGPEDLTFRKVVEIVEASLGRHKIKLPVPESLTRVLGRIAGLISVRARANFESSFASKMISDQMGECTRCTTRLSKYYKPRL